METYEDEARIIIVNRKKKTSSSIGVYLCIASLHSTLLSKYYIEITRLFYTGTPVSFSDKSC